jgi:membrane-bound lytic murein transglycosylase F
MTIDSIENRLTRTHPAFAGKTIYVQEGTPHSLRLRSLSKEIGKRLTIKKVQSNSEELIQRVADGEIDYAVCDENVSLVNATYYPDIDVSTPVSSPQGITWGIRRTHSGRLLKELNQWIVKFRKTKTYAVLFDKYYENKRSSRIVKSDYYTLSTGKISPYDELIKIYSDSISWDWRLLASLICQESRFEPYVKSWAGAYGLMQLMPATGRKYGINIASSPGNNIKAGTRYIESLEKIFEPMIHDEKERYRFILASYNAGPGHILDAMKLAEKHGKDPTIWDGNVAELLLKKSDPQYYNDTVVKNGYCRGKESVNFVSEILERYEHYKNIIPIDSPE